MAPKSEHNNETSTKSETWQLLMNLDRNNGAIHLFLKIYILWSIDAPWESRGQKMALKLEHSNETSTESETWQLLVNFDQNNGPIHFYLKIYILKSIDGSIDFGAIFDP